MDDELAKKLSDMNVKLEEVSQAQAKFGSAVTSLALAVGARDAAKMLRAAAKMITSGKAK